MAATLKKPSWEKEEAGAGNIMLDAHPLHPSRPFPNRKPNRENRIKNACFSNSHSNIAASNDKRPLFVQIPATSSASLVSTSLPIQCLRPSNFFFFRGIFAYNFLRNLLEPPHQRILTTSERITTTSERIKGPPRNLLPIHRKEGRSTLVAGCPSLSCGVYSVAPGRGERCVRETLSR